MYSENTAGCVLYVKKSITNSMMYVFEDKNHFLKTVVTGMFLKSGFYVSKRCSKGICV